MRVLRLPKRNTKGFTLIEVLVAIAIVSIAVIAVGRKMERSNVASLTGQLVDDITYLRAAAVNWRGSSMLYDYTDENGNDHTISIGTLDDVGIIDVTDDENTAEAQDNPAGGTYTIAPDGTDASLVVITASNLEDEVCNNLIFRFDPKAQDTDCTGGVFTLTVR